MSTPRLQIPAPRMSTRAGALLPSNLVVSQRHRKLGYGKELCKETEREALCVRASNRIASVSLCGRPGAARRAGDNRQSPTGTP